MKETNIMEEKSRIVSVSEWLGLPEISTPHISGESEEGATSTVLKVGFLAVSGTDCETARVSASLLVGDRCILPTAVIELGGGPVLRRLPIGLANWVIDCVALAKAGKKLFPTQVEFGELHGNPYADFKFERSASH